MSVFREYDIRGIADTELSNEFAWALGLALAQRLKLNSENHCYVGRDVRLSSPALSAWLAAGLEAGGITPRMLSPGPTPLLYFCAHEPVPDFKTRSGLMVTASHNPGEYNGFKMVVAGTSLYGGEIQKLKSVVEENLPKAPKSVPLNRPEFDRSDDYVAFCQSKIKPGQKFKVVLDGGNGAGGPLGIRLLEAIGCEVIPLFCEPDGRFPNHHPDPTVPKNLKDLIAKVKETRADLGIAFDGDADRIGAVSGTGRILFGDQLVLFYSKGVLREVPGATIISEVKSSRILYDKLKEWGANPLTWKTGHSLIKAKLKETKGALAGEMSGHMFFAHGYLGFDDALFAGAKLVEGLRQEPGTLDTFLDSLPKVVNTPEIRLDCPDEKKFEIVKAFTEKARKTFPASDILDIDGARINLMGGWGLIRASNTGPLLVLRFEAPDEKGLAAIQKRFADLILEIDSEVAKPLLA